MPWDQISTMDQKRLFISDYLTRSFAIVALCERYGVSRPTAYKWIRRFLNHGDSGLEELPRRPSHCPHRTPDALVEVILELRRRHPTWGAKKLLKILDRRRPNTSWPARSTTSDILKRPGGRIRDTQANPRPRWSDLMTSGVQTIRANSRPEMESTAIR